MRIVAQVGIGFLLLLPISRSLQNSLAALLRLAQIDGRAATRRK